MMVPFDRIHACSQSILGQANQNKPALSYFDGLCSRCVTHFYPSDRTVRSVQSHEPPSSLFKDATLKRKICLAAASVLLACVGVLSVAQQPPPPRMHKITSKGVLEPLPATSEPPSKNEVTIEVVGDQRIIKSNGIPNHKTGQFPNRGNPNTITVQQHEYRVPANPKVADQVSPMHGEFGVAINGVPFDPGAGEFYDGERGWQYEPLSGAIALGIDVSHAHVQPTGKYHYHGLPTGLLDSVEMNSSKHSPLIGWAADGFPMYAVYGLSDPKKSDSSITAMKSSYRLKKGNRPGGNAPDGEYDGTFVRDYEYVEDSGDLDECNGRLTITPDYPDGIYAYFMTEDWPVVPRNYRGTPSADFRHGPGGPPKPGEILPSFVIESLNLTPNQTKQLDALQTMVKKRLEKMLTKEQREKMASMEHHGAHEQGGPRGGGQRPEGGRPEGGPPGGRGPRGGRPGGDQSDSGRPQ